MSFFRVKTVKKNGRSYAYLYRQTSVRKGKKVKSKMEYLGALGFIAWSAISPGKPGGYSGHKSTDKRSIRHQDASDRERFDREMEHPKEAFRRAKAHAEAVRQGKPKSEPDPEFDALTEEMRAFGESLKSGK
jgi:hypothetical protein